MTTNTNTTNTTNVSEAKLSEGLALAATVVKTVKDNYVSDLAATSALGAWVKRITTGKRGSKVTLNDLVKAFDGAPGTSKGALSKAMTVAATTVAQRRDYLSGLALDARPSVDGLYLSVRTVTPRAGVADSGSETTPEPVETDASDSTDDAGTRVFTDDMASQVAREFLAGLHTRGASVLQINLVIAELDKLNVAVQAA